MIISYKYTYLNLIYMQYMHQLFTTWERICHFSRSFKGYNYEQFYTMLFVGQSFNLKLHNTDEYYILQLH